MLSYIREQPTKSTLDGCPRCPVYDICTEDVPFIEGSSECIFNLASTQHNNFLFSVTVFITPHKNSFSNLHDKTVWLKHGWLHAMFTHVFWLCCPWFFYAEFNISLCLVLVLFPSTELLCLRIGRSSLWTIFNITSVFKKLQKHCIQSRENRNLSYP